MRIQVAESNYKMRNTWQVPKTVLVTSSECETGQVPCLDQDAQVTFSGWSTADALLRLTLQRPGRRVCGLNFANGSQVGGGYKTGAVAQEEDLCRRLPNLYTSLFNAKREGLYPFGPSTCSSKDRPEKYSDVLVTAGLVVARQGEDQDFKLLPREQQVRVSLVTAAAPNINFAKEVYDLDLMYKTVRAIFIAPRLIQPDINTLVLGAWGCGAFGGKPEDVSGLFAKALAEVNLRRLYREIHFAIPQYDPSDINAEVFRRRLAEHGIKFQDMTG